MKTRKCHRSMKVYNVISTKKNKVYNVISYLSVFTTFSDFWANIPAKGVIFRCNYFIQGGPKNGPFLKVYKSFI